MVVSDEPQAQLERLKYLVAQATAAGLVESPLDWPGLNCAKALLEDEPLSGYWFNRSEEWEARRRGETYEKYDYATRYEIELQPPPALSHLSKEEYREVVAGLVREAEEEGAAKRGGRGVLGAAKILAQDPHKRLGGSTSPASKLFYADSAEELARLWEGFLDFLSRYRFAAGRLRMTKGLLGVRNPARDFPEGSFPPALPFVGGRPMPPLRTPPTRRLETVDLGDLTVVRRGEIPTVRVSRSGRPVARQAQFKLPRNDSVGAQVRPSVRAPPS